MAVITIDDKQYTVADGNNLLEVCLSEGLNLPYFCWHPAMGSVGACRQCAAKQYANDDDTRGRLVTACMTPVQDGQRFSINGEQEKHFRANVIASLMTNHPHDCPVCEEGGECHLQDMTEMSGHTTRNYRGKKRTHHNQQLGPLLNHEMNRCISCYRCVRFYGDYAGGRDLVALASHSHVYFGRDKDGVLANEFAGNLAEVCPTGVFTDKPFSKHYSRKWDLQTAPSICTHCAVGCNITPGARYGTIRRIQNRYHSEINGYFLCDKGRFGYAFNHHDQRLLAPAVTGENGQVSAEKNLQDSVEKIANVIGSDYTNTLIVGVGSARASLENNFALRQFVGLDNFYAGVSLADYDSHRILAKQLLADGLDIANVKQIEQADLVIILGEDIAETAPRISLALRQTVKNKGMQAANAAGIKTWQNDAARRYGGDIHTPLLLAALCATRLDEIASHCIHVDPKIIARIGFYIADVLNHGSSDVCLDEAAQQWAMAAVTALKQAKNPLIIAGSGYQLADLTHASLRVFSAVKHLNSDAKYYFVFPEANSLGLALLSNPLQKNPVGLHRNKNNPDRPICKKNSMQDLKAALKAAGRDNKRRVLMVLENDLYRTMDNQSIDCLRDEVDQIIVFDHSQTPTSNIANTVIAVSTVFESEGTLISNEARAQRFFSVMPADAGLQPSWRYLCATAQALQHSKTLAAPLIWTSLTDWHSTKNVTAALVAEMPELALIAALDVEDPQPFARQTHRFSGRTAMAANIAVAEKRPPQDSDTTFVYSMEGRAAHGVIENSNWAPGWNSNQAIHKYQTGVNGPLAAGESGVRLFEFQRCASLPCLPVTAEYDNQESSSWCAYPLHYVFGSDELSIKAQAIASLSPAASLVINPADANDLDLHEWDTALFATTTQSMQLYVHLDSSIPKGIVGILSINTACITNHWPVSVQLTKDANALPKPVSLIATDGANNNA